MLQFGSLANGSFVAQWKNNITTPLLAPIQPMFPGDDSLSSTQKIGIALAVIGIVVFIIILGSWYFGEPVKHLIGRSYYGIIWSIRYGIITSIRTLIPIAYLVIGLESHCGSACHIR